MNGAVRMRVMQLASQALPIGGFSHSLGLEAAVESRVVRDEATLAVWMGDLLNFCVARYDLPLLRRFLQAWRRGDAASVAHLNAQFLASRETAELRAASVQMGFSLRALLDNLADTPAELAAALRALPEPSLPCAWAGLGVAWALADEDVEAAYLWSWAENQVLAALKTIPLGQSAGQRLLLRIGDVMEELRDKAGAAAQAAGGGETAALSNFAPALAILSARHETQYTRLFRS